MAETLVQGPQGDYNAALSPDHLWMLYIEASPATVNAAVSPQRLIRRPVVGGSPEIVLQDPGGDIFTHWWSYRCAPQSNSSCVLGEKNGNEVAFYSLDPARGKGELLGKIEGSSSMSAGWNLSSDGSSLALIDEEKHKGRVEVLKLRDHSWHEVPVDLGQADLLSVAWAANGNGFFATSSLWSRDSFNLLHIKFNGKVTPLLSEERHQPFMNFLPSPDGKYLAFEAQTWDSNVWMLEGF